MSEWWTYRLSDFLLFSPQTYYRLFELQNTALWPAQVPALAAGLAILVLLRRGGAMPARAIAVLLGLAWIWIGWFYHRGYYAPINWAAEYYAIGFGLQGVLLLFSAAWSGRLAVASGLRRARIGWSIAAVSIILLPLLPLVLGRSWKQAELFGVAPDPTAAATLGILLAMHRIRWELAVLPLLWCVVTGLTLWTMDAPDFWLLPLAGIVMLAFAFREKGTRGCSGRARA